MSALGPYADALGIVADGDALLLPFSGGVEGRPGFLHGGAIGALLEAAGLAAFDTAGTDRGVARRIVTISIDFLRAGLPVDTRARGVITRMGRRIVHVEASAWQDDPARPIGAARMTLVIGRSQA